MTPERTYRKSAQVLRTTPKPEREYVLAKADGTYSARNCYSAISRIAGFYPGSRIIPADEKPV